MVRNVEASSLEQPLMNPSPEPTIRFFCLQSNKSDPEDKEGKDRWDLNDIGGHLIKLAGGVKISFSRFGGRLSRSVSYGETRESAHA